jgi:hypothetical protein
LPVCGDFVVIPQGVFLLKTHTFSRFINEVAARKSFNIFVHSPPPTLFLVVEGYCANREKLEKMHTFLLFGFVNHGERFGARIT